MSYDIQTYRKKCRAEGVDIKKKLLTPPPSIIIIIFFRYVWFKWIVQFLSHWMAARLGQTGGGGGLAFLLPKDSIKASFLHHCGGERERHTSSSVLLLLSAGGERWVTSHHWQLASTLIMQQSWYWMIIRACISLHFKHLGQECIGSGGALWLLCMSLKSWTGHGSSSIIRHRHCKKKGTQMAVTFMHVV